MPQRRIWLSVITRIAVCTLLVGGALGVLLRLIATAPTPAVVDQSQAVPRVLAFQVVPTAVRRQWHGFGTAQAVNAADVPARVSAVVLERFDHVRAGRPVAAGDVLMILDDSDFLRQVEIASQSIEDLEAQISLLEVERRARADRVAVIERELALAQSDLERTIRAMESDAAKQREVDLKQQAVLGLERTLIAAREDLDKTPLRRSSLEALKARESSLLSLAQQNLERCRIVAPIGGVLSAVDIDVGESADSGQRVARIVDLSRIEVPLLLPSSSRQHVQVGDDVMLFTGTGTPGLSWPASVSRVAPDDDPATRTWRVFVEVHQDPAGTALLAPGTFVQGTVTSAAHDTASLRTLVPRRAISGQRIRLVEHGRIRSVPVTVDFQVRGTQTDSGLSDTQWAVLEMSLAAGTVVVLDGSRALPDGSAVEAVLVEDGLAHRSRDLSPLPPDEGASQTSRARGSS